MEGARHFFPGGNTSQGFYSRFAHILPRNQISRKIILKGGPGVGKSTLMRRVAEYLQGIQQDVEFFHCSSDPDSLDGIAAPGLGFALIDGTAPHVMDPVLPGAEDGILNLGECLREEQLGKSRRLLRDAMEEIARCFLRVYDYLGAAAPLLYLSTREWREHTPLGAMENLAQETAGKWLPEGVGLAQERELFAEAYTPRGYMTFLPTLLQKRVACISAPWGLSPHPLLSKIRDIALTRGIPVLGLYNPLLPGELSHLNFPSLSLSVVTGPVENPSETLNLQEALSLGQGLSREQAFNRNAHELLLQRAVESLKEAKARHDDLEKYYIAAMDFGRWESALEKVKETVEALAALSDHHTSSGSKA
jgi:hypothetical protein